MLSKAWWIFLIAGVLWLIMSLIVFRMELTTVYAISILFGVIAIAAGTVLLPEMSRRIAKGDIAGAHAAQNRAAGFSLALSAPFTIAFLTLPGLMMTALFQRGAFSAEDAARAASVSCAISALCGKGPWLMRATPALAHSAFDGAPG